MRRILFATLAICLFGLATDAFAQSGISRPYDNFARRPSVSPYLNLVNQNPGQNNFQSFNSGIARYQNLVRPQLENRQRFSRQQNQLRGLQNQIQEIRSTAIGGIQNSTGMGFQMQGVPTGHQSLFQYHSRYYPALNRR